ncbi:hypothetical protein Tco_1206417 [Tanacetum coccineum]
MHDALVKGVKEVAWIPEMNCNTSKTPYVEIKLLLDLVAYGDHNGSNAKAKRSMEIDAVAVDEYSENALEGSDDMSNSEYRYIRANESEGHFSLINEVEILKRQLEDQAKEAREWEVVVKGQQATAEERDRAVEERVNELEQQVKEISIMMKTLKPPPSPRPS